MSLLMEALRKAEEAKSKASKEDASQDIAGAETTPADVSLDDGNNDSPAPDEPPAKEQGQPETAEKEGPVVINPDPDEEEILAAHSLENSLELVEMEASQEEVDDSDDSEVEQVDFTPYTPPETAAEDAPLETFPAEENDDAPLKAYPADEEEEKTDSEYFSEDDGLSLLQSSYFSRTQNTGKSSLEDEFPDTSEEPESDSFSQAAFTESANESPSQESESAVESSDEFATPDNSLPEPAAEESSSDIEATDNKAQEKTNRDSANSLFLAKKDSHKRRLKKLMSIAAVALLFPLAGIVYWLFTSLNSSSDMQFNVQAGNMANRSLSDSIAAQVAPPAAETDSQTELDSLASSANSSNQSQQLVAGELNGTDDPDTTLPSVQPAPGADNEQVQVPALATAETTAPPVLAPASESSSPAANPTIAATPVQQPQQNVASNNTPQAENTAAAPASQGIAQQGGLSFTRTAPEQVINPDLNAAYDSYQQGDYTAAGRLYQQVLQNEPNNRDAILHLASVYLKQSNAAMARNLYTRLLELNPRDPLARAGLLETVQGDPVRQETELKSLISAYPDTAQLSFALGNLYATQNRWSEAQNAYFNALLAAKSNSTGPVSPDYAFNLAISLERINQLRAALDYYREAKALSGTTSPGFNPAVLDQRLSVLEQRLR